MVRPTLSIHQRFGDETTMVALPGATQLDPQEPPVAVHELLHPDQAKQFEVLCNTIVVQLLRHRRQGSPL